MAYPALLTFLSRTLRRILSALEQRSLAPDHTYEQWQYSFFRRRLFLVFAISLTILFCMTTPRFVQNMITGQPLPGWWFTDLWVEVSLITNLILLRLSHQNWQINLIFLGYSGSINLVEQLAEAAMGGRQFDILDDFFNWVLVFFLQSTLIPVRWQLHCLCHILTYGLYFAIKCAFAIVTGRMVMWYPEEWTSPPSWIFTLSMVSFVATLSVYLFERTAKAEFAAQTEIRRAYQKLTIEQERSEGLLRNILPDRIACRLKNDHQTIADTFADTTVLFADIVGFTELSSQISAHDLVELLNSIFSRFDQLAAHHNLEKIKTIGDAYLVVAGLPNPREDHSDVMAEMALDMQRVLVELNGETGRDLSLRIGIHAGTVVAGVIGLTKFAYDIWGDTVNTASRMESHGVPGKIQVSEVVYRQLAARYDLEARGMIAIKGKGEMMTYFLRSRRHELPPAAAPQIAPPQSLHHE
ncbi:adenylate/guanylate cyclase domain-containing protein [Spirulina major CS-329]|uniref:adenylate/guanylate cyclase domain-containing protein n=1 Tax=Spirulina TaxID=1154 RepID=UPI00232FB140|nr:MULTISPECIES: adenylate/guanylate cyclase domain-containing protein [Spirulina]MDB9495674.1 adenylate/guanylate cyclase domain-containing protein [Spirulina subsalsa CS-330]MDB9505333.1 adenylate/guanylate cyclase domain-containing protein [Spirulina major CS-329]